MGLNNKYTVGDLFAGVGGLSKAFQQTGAKIVWANEFDRNACRLYRENFSDLNLIEGDIDFIRTEEIPDVDILVAKFPYLNFQIVGQRKRDFESKILLSKILRILSTKRPRVFLLESVKNLMRVDNGEIFKESIDLLNQYGYFIKYKVLNSKEYANIPHNKERLYIVGFRDIKESEIFKFPEKIQLNLKINDVIDIEDKKEEKYYYNEYSNYYRIFNDEVRTKGKIYQLKLISRKWPNFDNKIIKSYDICPALTSYISKIEYIPVIKDNYGIRMLTPNECFMLQGFRDIKIPKEFREKLKYKYAVECSSVEVVKRIAENIFKILLNDRSKKFDYEVNQEIIINNENKGLLLDIYNEEIKKDPLVKDKEIHNEIEEINIKNENDFTTKKVIPALKKRFSEVKYNHGNDEYGKDVLYKYLDNFGSIKYGAAQVKYGNISGDMNGEIERILTQIKDSFEMPYIDVNENRQNYINQLLIICSGRYTKNAKEKILKKFNTRYDVRFFDGQDIDNLLEK